MNKFGKYKIGKVIKSYRFIRSFAELTIWNYGRDYGRREWMED